MNINKQPKSKDLPKVKAVKPTFFTLSNGIKVFVIENHKLPSVYLEVRFDRSIRLLGKNKGHVQLLSQYLGKYSEKYEDDFIRDQFDFMGTKYWVNVNGFGFSGLSKYFDDSFKYTTAYLLQPKFEKQLFENEKLKIIEKIKADENNPSSIGLKAERKILYGAHHPFGEVIQIADIEKVTYESMRQLYADYIKPNNGYMLITGDITAGQVRETAEKYLSDWKKTKPFSEKKYKIKPVQQSEIHVVHVPSAQQTTVSFLSTTHYTMNDPDFFPIYIANLIFGGIFDSRLNKNLREDKGLTYGAGSSISPNRYVSQFRASAKVNSEKVLTAVSEIKKELDKIHSEKVTQQELNLAKTYSIGYFVMNAAKPEIVLNQTYNKTIYGLADDFYQKFIEKINQVTAEDILQAVQKHFNRDKMQIIITGNANLYQKEISKPGIPVTVYNKNIKKIQKKLH